MRFTFKWGREVFLPPFFTGEVGASWRSMGGKLSPCVRSIVVPPIPPAGYFPRKRRKESGNEYSSCQISRLAYIAVC